MKKYVEQLIQDIENAKLNKPDKPEVALLKPDHPALEYGLDHIAEWECAPYQPMHELLGLEPAYFPPEEKLNDEMITALVSKLLDLWEVFNFYPDFPENLPDRIRYKFLVQHLEEDVQYVSEGMIHIEFCDYEPEKCPFGQEYCHCRGLRDD